MILEIQAIAAFIAVGYVLYELYHLGDDKKK